MSHLQFEQELASAVRLDTSIHVGSATATANPRGRPAGSSLKTSFSAKRILSTSTGVATIGHLNRSQSETRLHPALANGGRSRSKTPTRHGNSLLDLSGSSNGSGRNSKSPFRGDRFIPNRSTTDVDYAYHSLSKSRDDLSSNSSVDVITEQLRRQKMSEMLQIPQQGDRILSFRQKAPAADESHANNLKVLYSTGKPKAPSAAKQRQVQSKAEKVLDAPEFLDDFYLHLVDWSANNHLAVALNTSIFVWNADSGEIDELLTKEAPEDYICCLNWVQEGNILAFADPSGTVELMDVTQAKLLRSMEGHTDRVASLAWQDYNLASGCRDGRVHLHDVRVAQHHVQSFLGHTQEVCGAKWSSNGRLLATGGNDNLVMLWDRRRGDQPLFTLNQHQSAVKALNWCPWQPNTLATGGGTSDRCIKFWNAANGELIQSVDCGSQVSSIVWNAEYKELISGHGFSHNQLTVWSYPKMTKVADLKGHTSRILDVISSPDGTMVASAAADETIRLWKVWPTITAKKVATKAKEKGGLMSQRMIR